jgi:hypothetical protein
MSITHSFTSTKTDGEDTSLVRPTNWNAVHTISGYETGQVLFGNMSQDAGLFWDNTSNSKILSIKSDVNNYCGILRLGCPSLASTYNDLGFVQFCNGTQINAQIYAKPIGSNLDSGSLRFYTRVTGGALSLRLTIFDSGEVGIGAPSPTNILSLGNTTAQKFWIENSITDVVGRALTIAAGGTIAGTNVDNVIGGNLILQSGLGTGTGESTISFQTGTTLTTGKTLQTMSTKMTILGNGNVGIGIENPTHILQVRGSGYAQVSITDEDNRHMEIGISGAAVHYGAGIWMSSTQQINLYNAGISLGSFVSNDPPAGGLSCSGSVGIGDPSPGELLDVAGNIDLTGVLKIDDIQVVSNRVVDSRISNTPNSGDATTDDLIDAMRDAMLSHGLMAAS